MAAIAYGKGVIAAEQYHDRINAESFSSFICEHFASMFNNVWDKVGAGKLAIPARSLSLNPTENIFHIVKRKSLHDALELAITREDFESFSTQVKRT